MQFLACVAGSLVRRRKNAVSGEEGGEFDILNEFQKKKVRKPLLRKRTKRRPSIYDAFMWTDITVIYTGIETSI